MKTFRDLEIILESNQISEFITQIERRLTNGWRRDIKGELEAHQVAGDKFYYFVCEKTDVRPEALVALANKNPNTLYVTNIVPSEGELAYDGYNLLLKEFSDLFVKPVANIFGGKVTMTRDDQSIEDWMSAESVKKLRTFCGLANKSSGGSHPMDKARWYDFIISVVEQGDSINSSQLERWLVENDNWRQAFAKNLAIEFEQEIGLLKHYRTH